MQGVNASNGKRLSGDAHLRQSITDILTTPKKSRVLLRDYGSDLPTLVDNPQDELTRVRIIAASASALARWEPRLQVKRISVSFESQGVTILAIEGVNIETGKPLTLDGIQLYGNQP